jgi:DNA-binding CsgD family transcriptional regulator
VYVPLSTVRRAVDLVEELAELTRPDDFGDGALPGLCRLIGADTLTYNVIDPAAAQVRYTDYPFGALPPHTRAIFARYVHQHPVVNHYRATGDAQALRISDVVGRAGFHRLDLYAEFFRQVSTEHQLAVTLSGTDGQVVGIALNRARRDFTDTDRELLTMLRAPLVAALLRVRGRHDAHRGFGETGQQRLAELTGGELRVLRLVALGGTNVAVARELEVSPRTVAKHLEHIYRKLGVRNRAAAVAHPGEWAR